MNLDPIIARAAPPPERVGGPFVPIATDADQLRRRQERMAEAFGSRAAAAAHAESMGVHPDVWFDRLRDVRLDGDDPVWAATFREFHERLADGPYPFAGVRLWAGARLAADWPPGLPRGPEALEGFLDYLARRIATPVDVLADAERRLGVTPSWDERLERNPALAWVFGQVTADWLADATTMMRRAASDRSLYARALIGAEDPGRLLRVEAGLGDPHEGGRSVAILRFERGSVVYKPKDLRIAARVGEIAAQIGEPGIAGPSILVRDGYAWEAEYRARPLAEPGDADAFYRALGGWLALLQALGAVDFWFDNLIADGAIPRFIDFETAVQPLGFRLDPDAPLTDVIRTDPSDAGILPTFLGGGDGREPTDLGCLTRPGRHRVPTIVTGSPTSWEESRFAPHLAGGKPVDGADHFEAFEEGYLRVARTLRDPAAQSRLVGVLRQSPDAAIRVILADTWTCYHLIRRSLAFGRVADGVWREIEMHGAITRYAEVTGSLREGVVGDLRRLDVPLFQTRLNSRDLVGGGSGRRPKLFPLDALSEVRRRMRVLAAEPEDQRLRRLRSVFSLRANNHPRRPSPKSPVPPASAGDLLEWAGEIAAGIERQAKPDNRGKPNWVGAHMDPFSGWRGIVPLGPDVLSGRAGLALALFELAVGLERPELAALGCEALEAAAEDYLDSPEYLDASGFVVGVGGLVAALARAPELRPLAVKVYGVAAAREVWARSGGDFVSGLEGWRRAAAAIGDPAPRQHGRERTYTPQVLPRLAPWLDGPKAAPLCADRRIAARLRRNRDRHGVWFAHLWLDDSHNLSGVDGLSALAVAFIQLAANDAATDLVPGYLR